MSLSSPKRAVFIIAEAGVNHNGRLDLAREMIDVAASAGADAVKFQTFRADEIATASASKAAYQERSTDTDESQRDMLAKLQLDADAHDQLASHARARSIEFMSTPFDPESVALLSRLGVRRLKIASGEVTNPLLLRAAARTEKPLIISTGMCSLAEVEMALGVIASEWLGRRPRSPQDAADALSDAGAGRLLAERIVLLHCTTEYPAPFSDVNLRAMQTLGRAFGLPFGYSDHTLGIAVSIASAALGASVIEKHFTLGSTMPGPDHAASLEPSELRAMVEGIRAVESSLGDGRKHPVPSELPNRAIARRSLVASVRIAKGEPFTPENLTVKRPGTGVPAIRYDELIGRPATRDYEPDELVDP